ncbi:MAG: LytTR family DNA-binding domain-containing protein [Prevotellaceae bacterium]|jgi:DNA-binding LytR/AlgR family response regulator|nr:LytTR family DNA-binding domain-containing protein [Prevotellaceae bacterium]
MKVLIVEDETVAYTNLKKIISEINPEIEVIGNTESIKQTVNKLQETSNLPDLIFMDIHLSDGSAFNIFNLITVEIPIVFTTAYDEYAIEAFKVNSIDYLLKPIEVEEVRRALDKFKRLNKQDIAQYLNVLSQLMPPQDKYPEKILVPIHDKLIPVSLDSISCFYTTDEKTVVILKSGKNYPYKKTLDSIIQTLNPKYFLRVNKQHIVSKKSIVNITIWFDSRLLITLDTETPERIFVSKNKAAEFKQWMTL